MGVRPDPKIVSERRKLLGAAGSALLASFAGCASVIGGTADGPETTTDASQTTTATTTSSANGTGTTASGNVSQNSTGNVSGQGNETAPANSESLGRVSIDQPDLSISKSLVPAKPKTYDYARLGSDDADVTATLFGNWKCPYTREFVRQMMGEVVQKFIQPGDVALEFRALSYLDGEPFLGSDAPRAARAGLEIWESNPQKFWNYFTLVFGNQPPEEHEWATADRLVRFAKAANVGDTDTLSKALFTGAHRKQVKQTTERAGELGIATVPRVVTEEAVTAPTVDFSATKRQLRRASQR